MTTGTTSIEISTYLQVQRAKDDAPSSFPTDRPIIGVYPVKDSVTFGEIARFQVQRRGLGTSSCAVLFTFDDPDDGVDDDTNPLVVTFDPNDLVVEFSYTVKDFATGGDRIITATLSEPLACILDASATTAQINIAPNPKFFTAVPDTLSDQLAGTGTFDADVLANDLKSDPAMIVSTRTNSPLPANAVSIIGTVPDQRLRFTKTGLATGSYRAFYTGALVAAPTVQSEARIDFVVIAPPVNTGLPSISGGIIVGNVLTCTTGTWTGHPTPTYSFRWQRGTGSTYTNITNATNQTYTLVSADIGQNVRCQVTANNSAGTAVATAAPVGPITDVLTPPQNTDPPVVSGGTVVGNVLTCTTGTWIGNPTPTISFQWQRGTGASYTNITGATAATYTSVTADVGQNIRCRVTGTNSQGTVSVTTTALGPITSAAGKPVNQTPPSITGTLTVGSVLACSTGTWTNNPTYARQWRADGVDIPNATGATYTLVAMQQDQDITCNVRATNAAGFTDKLSNSVGPVIGRGFVKVATPRWTTLLASNISIPSFNATAANQYSPAANRGYDLREKAGRNHIPTVQDRTTPVNVNAANGAVFFGFKCTGEQEMHPNYPKIPSGVPQGICIWQMMKFGCNPNARAAGWDTGSLERGFGSPGGKDASWDDKHLIVKGSSGVNDHLYVECFASYNPMDGIDGGEETNQGTLHLTTFYMRNARDDAIQNDQLNALICTDFLMENLHTFISTRPGDSFSRSSPMIFRNGLIHLGRLVYFGNWGHGGNPSSNTNSLFTGPYVNSSNRGLPVFSDTRYGYAHSSVWKDSPNRGGSITFENCLFYDQGMSLGGDTNTLTLPPGTYTNVTYIFVGEAGFKNALPAGITLITNRDVGDALWKEERELWCQRHGNPTFDGNDFDFLHRPATLLARSLGLPDPDTDDDGGDIPEEF